jgi:hypothetical protein
MKANLCEAWGSRASWNVARGWMEVGFLLTFVLIALI